MRALKQGIGVLLYGIGVALLVYGGILAIGSLKPPRPSEPYEYAGLAIFAICVPVSAFLFALADTLLHILPFRAYIALFGFAILQVLVAYFYVGG